MGLKAQSTNDKVERDLFDHVLWYIGRAPVWHNGRWILNFDALRVVCQACSACGCYLYELNFDDLKLRGRRVVVMDGDETIQYIRS